MADPSQPGDPDEPDERPDEAAFRASRPSCSAVRRTGGGGNFDPATFDFSQIDLTQVMRILQSTGPVNWEVARQTAE